MADVHRGRCCRTRAFCEIAQVNFSRRARLPLACGSRRPSLATELPGIVFDIADLTLVIYLTVSGRSAPSSDCGEDVVETSHGLIDGTVQIALHDWCGLDIR